MKIEIKENQKQGEVKYPCLMQNKANKKIVLFTNVCTGTVVASGDNDEIGHYSSGFDIRNYNHFNGTLTLSND